MTNASFSEQRIFLIGLPGAGKTTLGRALAQEMAWPFVDLDEAIEQRTGTSVADIFRTQGEAVFRQLEAEELRRVGLAAPLVLATGGGTPCFHDSMPWLLAHGRVVWLDVPPAAIADRLAANALSDRPLLAAAGAGPHPEATAEPLARLLKQTLTARQPFYARAPWHYGGPDTGSATALRQLLGL